MPTIMSTNPLLLAGDHDAIEVLNGEGDVLDSIPVSHQVGAHLLKRITGEIIIYKDLGLVHLDFHPQHLFRLFVSNQQTLLISEFGS